MSRSEPESSSVKSIVQQTQIHAHTVRSQRIEEFSFPDADPSEILHGYCHENAAALGAFLDKKGYDVTVIWGAVSAPGEPGPVTIEDAEKEGSVHFWVEARKNGVEVVADIASEIPDEKGKVYVGTTRPEMYVVPEGGRIQYSEEVIPRRMLNIEGWEWLEEKGLVEEHHTQTL